MGLNQSQELVADNFLTLSESGQALSGASFFKFVAMHNLKLVRPLVFFDLETTGISISKDRICQISFIKIFPQPKDEKPIDPLVKSRVINPEINIPEEASKVHGITNEVAQKSVKFSQIASSLAEYLEGCDLAGYNLKKFDIPMLREEFLRCGIDSFPSQSACVIDVFAIIRKVIPRNLSAMYELFTGQVPEQAHDADYDNMMTMEVLKSLLDPDRVYTLDPRSTMKGINTVEDLHDLSESNTEWVDLAGKIIVNERTSEYEWNFGKHKGERVLDHRSYAKWMLTGDFTEDTKDHIMQIFRRAKKDIET